MPAADAWRHFLSEARVGSNTPPIEKTSKATVDSGRSEFHKDYDRIIFSSAFRRLSDKTQVVPFPQSAYTRQRLTHSLEVSCVGRSLATHVYNALGADISRIRPQGDFEAIVAAACLAHDIGNPPFGHFGERAIQDWAKQKRDSPEFGRLTLNQRLDFERFEGNAQSFRVLTRLQMSSRTGGMRLTAAALGTMIKYPTFSQLADQFRYRKHGCFDDDRTAFEETFEQIGRTADSNGEYSRHPLALLSEAADDICYAIIDLEDGCQAGLISVDDALSILNEIQPLRFSESNMPDSDKLAMGRALSISTLVQQAVQQFLEHSDQIIQGHYSRSLISDCPASESYTIAKRTVGRRVFESARVLEMEAAGYQAIQGLLNILVPAALSAAPSGFESHVLALTGLNARRDGSEYQRILACTDYVSGMTDRYCLELFQKLSGKTTG
jgi:dGTPase